MIIVGGLSATPLQGPVAQPDPAMMEWGAKQRAFEEELLQKATARLAGSLGTRTGESQIVAFVTLMQYVQQGRFNRPPRHDPDWVAGVAKEFVKAFPKLEVQRKQYLLDMYSSTFEGPETAPLFESVLDTWKPGDYYEAAHSALRALNRVDPARGRARILAELAKEKTWLDPASLDLLPASAVPPMDDALIEGLARAQRPGGWNSQLSMAALARYATPRALPRIKSIYESQTQQCQPELVAYFVRVDPAYADGIFHSHAWEMQTMPPQCTMQIFQRTAQIAMSPGLEKYLAAYLMHSNVFIKSTAARGMHEVIIESSEHIECMAALGEAQIAESDVEPGREDIDVDFKDRFAERQIGQGGGTVHAEARGGFLSRIELLESVQSDDSYDAGVKVTQHGSSECIDETTYRIIQPIDKRLNHVERIELIEDCVEDVPPAAVGEARRSQHRPGAGGATYKLQADPARKLKNLQNIPTIYVVAERSGRNGAPVVAFLKQAGVDAEEFNLKDKGILGNGHFMMLENNRREVFDAIRGWLEQKIPSRT
jgi:hypothetical protein